MWLRGELIHQEQHSPSQSNGDWRGKGQALENGSVDKAIFCNREDQRGRTSALKPKQLSVIHLRVKLSHLPFMCRDWYQRIYEVVRRAVQTPNRNATSTCHMGRGTLCTCRALYTPHQFFLCLLKNSPFPAPKCLQLSFPFPLLLNLSSITHSLSPTPFNVLPSSEQVHVI